MRLRISLTALAVTAVLLGVSVITCEGRSLGRRHQVKVLALAEEEKDVQPVSPALNNDDDDEEGLNTHEEDDNDDEDDETSDDDSPENDQPVLPPKAIQQQQQPGRLTRSRVTPSCASESQPEKKVEEASPKLSQMEKEDPTVTEVKEDTEGQNQAPRKPRKQKHRRTQKSNAEEEDGVPKSSKIESKDSETVVMEEKPEEKSELEGNQENSGVSGTKQRRHNSSKRKGKKNGSTTTTTTEAPESDEENGNDDDNDDTTTPMPTQDEDPSSNEEKDKELRVGPVAKAMSGNPSSMKNIEARDPESGTAGEQKAADEEEAPKRGRKSRRGRRRQGRRFESARQSRKSPVDGDEAADDER